MDHAPIRIDMRVTFDATRVAVWKAITDEVQMRQWFFETMGAFKPQVGFEARFVVHNEGTDYEHVWTITEVVPEQRIAYGWRYEGLPGNSKIVWELSEKPEGTMLCLKHEETELFPKYDPAFSQESCQGGWEYFIGERLMAFLTGQNS